MVQELSRPTRAGVSGFRYDACDEHIRLAADLSRLAPDGLANREQQKILEHLQEENRVLREQLGGPLRLVTRSAVDSRPRERSLAGNCSRKW